MNVFVLCTGRCGSTTFSKACKHIKNYTVAHESKMLWDAGCVKDGVLQYPENHIEVDNRLSWHCGTLDRQYGDSAYYIHLIRNPTKTGASLVRVKSEKGILHNYYGHLTRYEKRLSELTGDDWLVAAQNYQHTVNNNVRLLLKDKPRKKTIWLSDIVPAFSEIWEEIGAKGDLEKALLEFNTRYN